MVFHPCILLEVLDCRAVHIHPAHPPYGRKKADGTIPITPCVYMQKMAIGNILEDNLEDLFKTPLFMLYKTHKVDNKSRVEEGLKKILIVQKMLFCGLLKNYLKDQNVLKLSGCLKEVFLANRTMVSFGSVIERILENKDIYVIMLYRWEGACMDLNLQITDMAGAAPDHSLVIVNFVSAIRKQLKNSTCYVYSDNVQYRFKTDNGENKIVIPDASINCRTKSKRGNFFIEAPRFVMEVLSPTTEKYDREEKMELYRQQEIEEYWIVDWRLKQVEIFELDYEKNIPKYYLWKTITEANKDDLKIIHFPGIKITFDELFEEVGMEY